MLSRVLGDKSPLCLLVLLPCLLLLDAGIGCGSRHCFSPDTSHPFLAAFQSLLLWVALHQPLPSSIIIRLIYTYFNIFMRTFQAYLKGLLVIKTQNVTIAKTH